MYMLRNSVIKLLFVRVAVKMPTNTCTHIYTYTYTHMVLVLKVCVFGESDLGRG